MPTDSECRKALTAIRELYVEIHDLDLDAYLLGKLFEVKVITRRQHDNIRARGGVDEFWDIIESSLRVGDKTKFVRLLEVMSTNDDTTVKDLAKKLSEAAEISISIPDPYPIDVQPVIGVEKSVDRGKGGGSFSMFQLLECMDCVCRIENCGGSDGGTGFVGNIKEEHFIITCHHIIPNETAAKEGLFMFNHNDDQYVPGKIRGEDLFDMTSSKWFRTDENLNYTAIKVDKVQLSNVRYTRKDGNEQTKMEISGIPLNLAKVDMPFDMEHIFTIIQQTPTMKLCEGSCKQRKDINSAMIQYRMNTFKGSGGSPIFKERNGELCLIAMHIGNQGSKKFNFGVRISEVLKDIKGKDHSPMPVDVREFTLE